MTQARIRVERRQLDGSWEPHSAWYGPEHRAHLERNVRMSNTVWDVNNTVRLAEEPDTPEK